MASEDRNDPYRSFNFLIEIDGIPRGAFSECSGLVSHTDSVDYRAGSDKSPNVRKLMCLQKFDNITLKRGYTQDKVLWQWNNNIRNGVADRRNVTIVLLNEERNAVVRWHVENAWIGKIEGPSFKASGNEIAMESIELIHEGLSIEM
jgi:phage tail-like protein